MRAFVAIDLDADIKKALQALVKSLEATGADVRWARAGGLHLTLKFLGEIDEAKAAGVKAAVAAVAGRHAPFALRLEGTGAFPGERNPRVLWVGFSAEPALAALQGELEAALEAEGFPREERAFKPHLTLGRIKGPGRIREVMLELGRHREEAFGEMTARRVALFESRLRPEGAEYMILFEADLA